MSFMTPILLPDGYIVPAEYLNEPGKHFPESVQYDLNDSYCDLLDFAARYVCTEKSN